MTINGSYQDHYLTTFRDQIDHERQQNGSVLSSLVMIEKMSGEKYHFDRLGKVASTRKNARNEEKTYSNIAFERRQITPETNDFNHNFDKDDLVRYVSDPKNAVTQAAVKEMGRTRDEIIMEAITDDAVILEGGASGTASLSLSVAVNSTKFRTTTGNTPLSTAKLKEAKSNIVSNYGALTGEKLFLIGSMDQIMQLSTEAEQVSGDYRSGRPLEAPGIDHGLSGFMGIQFIHYEGVPNVGSNEACYLITEGAIKLGVWIPLTVEVTKNTALKMNPDSLSVYESIGATRAYEEGVCQILCSSV